MLSKMKNRFLKNLAGYLLKKGSLHDTGTISKK